MERMVQTEDLIFEYAKRDEEGNVIGSYRAIDQVNLKVEAGQFIAILGHNGSGKSTLAKHINAILVPTEGTVWVGGRDTSDADELWNVRQSAGMVFQNPDNQIIGTVVEEDVGFGPENLGVPTDDIWKRVEEGSAPHRGGAQEAGEGNRNPDYPLHGRGDRRRSCICYGSRARSDGGDAKRNLLPGGCIKGIPPGCSAGNDTCR